ncbi:unnamed protein product [Caenorhabditis auriculariae]|uniref:Rootletin-like coiled-coil domain-containing protein n=1 Tax=Caenorhabditis auriculariae TaxID=2777116 RepID=A0A8S1HGE5_9PELO|nr:unnamed protein product [Caenorhabditis auriculariae]
MALRASLSSEDVAKVSEDLSQCRSRIEAGVEENKKNRQVIEDLNVQLQRYRKRAAESDSMTSLPTMPLLTVEPPPAISLSPRYERYERRMRHKSHGRLERYRSSSPHEIRYSPMHRSSPRLSSSHYGVSSDEDAENVEEVYARLKAELFKSNTLEEVNEMLREENDAALAANENLRVDVLQLSQQLQTLEKQQTNDHMRFRAENTRYHNQVENQHRKLIALWKAFTTVKRQVNDLKTTAANDLDRQMTEFTRCATLMQRAIRHAEEKNRNLREEMRKEKDEVLDETLRQLNTATENYMKAEEKANGVSRELRSKEDDLKKARQELEELNEALGRISRLASPTPLRNRARSESPTSSREQAMEVARKMRKLLGNKNSELHEAQEAVRRAEADRDRFKNDLAKEEKRRREEREADALKATSIVQRETQLKTIEDELKKSSEKIKHLEDQRVAQEKLVVSTQNALAEAHRLHKAFIEDLTKRHREELFSREEQHREELQQKTKDDQIRAEKNRVDKERARRDVEDLRESLRQVKAELAAMDTQLEDKNLRVELLEEENEAQRRRLADEQQHIDQRELEMQELRLKTEQMADKEVELRRELVEAQSVSSAMQDEDKQRQEDSMRLREELAALQTRIETLQADYDEQVQETMTLRKTVVEREEEVQLVNANIRQLNSSIDEANGEAGLFKTELERLHDQIKEKNKIISEVNSQLEETKRNCDILQDDVATSKAKADDLREQLQELHKNSLAKEQQEAELRSLLEDFRLNFDKLTNDGKQQAITIDALNEEIESLKSELKKREDDRKEEMRRQAEIDRQRDEALQADFDDKIRSSEKEKKDLEKLVYEAEGRLEHLTRIHEELMSVESNLRVDAEAFKNEIEEAQRNAKRDVEKLRTENERDREDWEAEKRKLESQRTEEIGHLNDQLAALGEEVRAKDARLKQMQKDLDSLRTIAETAEEGLRKNLLDSQDFREEMERNHHQNSEEKSRLVEERENAYLEVAKQSTNVERLQRQIDQLQTEIEKLNVSVVERESTIQALEQNTMELLDRLAEHKKIEEEAKDQLAVLSKQNSELKNGREGVSHKLLEEKKRSEELSEQVRELTKTVHSVRMKLMSSEEKKNDVEQQVSILNNKVRQLEASLADKTSKSDVSNDLLRKMEFDTQSMVKELQNERTKMDEIVRQNKKLENENRQLEAELQASKTALESKRESSKVAINDLLQQYRKAEEKASNLFLENQKVKSENTTIVLKLERSEKSRKELDVRVKESEAKAAETQTRLANFQRSAIDSLAYGPHTTKNRSPYVEIPRSISSVALNNPAPTQNDEIDGALDVSSSVGVTLRFLKERIEQLEADKAELSATIEGQREDMRQKTEKLKDAISELQRTRRSVEDLQSDKTSLESRMSSQRQMYLTNEESTRSKDQDLRNLKARIATLELHLREKEAKIGQSKNELGVLQDELREVKASKERALSAAANREERFRENEDEFERILKERDETAAKHRRMLAEHENTSRKLDQLESERAHLVRELTEERRVAQRNRELLDEARVNEKQWREAASTAKRSVDDDVRLVSEQRRFEQSVLDLTTRNEGLAAECERLRADVRDFIQKVNHLNLKVVESDRRNEDLVSRNAMLTQNVNALRNFEAEWKALEKEMREELKQLRKDKLTLTSESEDWRRRTLRNETEKKEVDAIRQRLEREIAALKKHVDALEEEKNRTEIAVKETMNERRAIDKSLAAMERENTQLYRNCSQLQTQISQLEKDAGSRSVAKLAKEHSALETRIAMLIEEKRQLQALLDQSHANFSHKRKLMESQMSLLREQLDVERKRRLQVAQREQHPHRRADSAAGARRAIQQSSAFRKTYERSMSCERTVLEQELFERFESTFHSPPISPLSHAESVTSGTLIMSPQPEESV